MSAEQFNALVRRPHHLSPGMRLVFAITLALLIVLILQSAPGLRDAIQPLQRFTAVLAFAVVKAIGLPIAIDGVLLSHPEGFRVAVSYGCTPAVPAIFLFSILTLGLSLKPRTRLIALSSGLVVVTFLNLFRVAVLYYIGVMAPGLFALAHEWLGQAFILVSTAIVACYWINTSVKRVAPLPAL